MIRYLKKRIVIQEMAKYSWPNTYTVEDHGDGIEVTFFNNSAMLIFDEVPGDNIYCTISNNPDSENTYFKEYNLYVDVIVPKVQLGLLADVDYKCDFFLWSEQNVVEKLINVLVRLQAYFLLTITGDNSLIVEYLQKQSGKLT